MKNMSFIALLGFCWLFSSCGDFLEPKSKSEFVPKDPNALNELLLGDAYPRYDLSRLNVFLGLLDDDIDSAPYQPVAVGVERDRWYGAFTWQPDIYEIFEDNGLSPNNYNVYEGHYFRILGANAVLDYISTVTGEQSEINLVLAQAHALRAFYYFNLVNIFGAPYNYDKDALGVPLKLTSEFENKNFTRNTVAEVYEQVIADLKLSEQYYETLPESLQWKTDYRASIHMARLLLSRVYLYMEEWESAAEYALKVIKQSSFRLWDLNTIEDKNAQGRGVYTYFHDIFTSPEVIWNYGNVSDMTSMISLLGDGSYYHPIFKASDELMATFNASDGDLRTTRYVVEERYQSQASDGSFYYLNRTFGKIAIGSTNEPLGGPRFARSYRLAEAYLNYMEANAMLYKEGGSAETMRNALDYLNTLRKYRIDTDLYQDIAISDANQLINYIRDERRRELCFEDHRWFDLRRYGMPEIKHIWIPEEGSVLEFTLKEKDPGYTLPIPQESIKLNNGLEQNPLAPKRGSN